MSWPMVEKLVTRVFVLALTLAAVHLEQRLAVVRAECQQVANRLSGW